MARPQENLKAYRRVLQPAVSVSDAVWSYNIPDFPAPAETNRLGLIKSIIVKTEGTKHRIILQLQQISVNRAIKNDPFDHFILVSFADFHARSLRHQSGEAIGTQPSNAKECSEYIIRLLRAGVQLQGIHYNFYGHSNSQLKSRTCFLFAAPKDVIHAKVEALGDFTKMKTVQKKAKRIGLLFSVAEVARVVDPKRCEDIPDIETGDYIFTDGCGLIAPKLAQDLSRSVGIKFRNVRYMPSVFQIRYRGYKGVVTVDPRMRGEPSLKMRKSMKKFSGGDDYSFAVVQYSKPYAFGHLNDEVILLLHSLDISSNTLLQKHQEHFDFLASAIDDPRSAFRFLTYINRFDLAERVLVESLDAIRPKVQSLVKAEHSKMINNRGKQKCRILIRKSRILFGVCDAWGVLKEGECQVRVTHDADGQPRTLKNADVLVTRNPCLHPGDLQKFRAVQKDELSHLVDCIVFSTRGKRPAADLMSGGDLDGDTFFVCWDSDIVPSTVSQAAEYPGAREPVSFKSITDDDRLVYFAKYTSASLGRVKNLYLDWARVHGPMSPQCQELNRLFSTCVDGNRIQIPPKLESPPRPAPDSPPFILDELHDAAKQIVSDFQRSPRERELNCEGYSFEAMEFLLSRDDLSISEFELVQWAWRWCRKNDASFEEFLPFLDFNLLNAEEKAWTLSKLPSTAEYSQLIQNALCQSSILEESELYDSKLHYPCLRWKRIFNSAEDRLATFPDTVAKALELFHRKLIVIQVDERLTVAIYVPQKIEKSRDCRVDNKVRMFAFPHSKGKEMSSRLSLPTKMDYQLYCDDNVFQLFEGRRQNSWVFITRGPSDDSSYRAIQGAGDRRRARQATIDSGVNAEVRTSVAVDKFSKNLQTHVGRVRRNRVLRAEIYVITNRDIKSLRNLDLWLEYVDTQTIVPLFERNAKEYTVPSLKDVDWSEVPIYVRQIVKRDDFTRLLMLDTAEQYRFLFSWLLERDQKEMLIRSFDFLLSSFGRLAFVFDAKSVLQEMLAFVRRCPVLAVSFSRLESWTSLPEELLTVLEVHAENLLEAFILSASSVGDIVVDPFKTVLARINVLPIPAYARLAELISLTVRSPDLGLDLLLDGLDRESHRLIPSRPAIIHHTVRNLSGIAIDHISEAAEQSRTREDLIDLKLLPRLDDGYQVVQAEFRIDSKGGKLENSAHVRLLAASPPSNSLSGRVYSMDALVISSGAGSAKFKCFHAVPPYLEQCSWKLQYCGPFVTAKTMFDAVLDLTQSLEECCGVSGLILGYRSENQGLVVDDSEVRYVRQSQLNESQNAAVVSALKYPLTCLWGPPGTGKTHTIVEIIKEIQKRHGKARILVTAPTHNAVDNVMRRYLKDSGCGSGGGSPLRVSTEVRKVSEDLRKHTVDAMAGQEVYASHQAMRKAEKMVRQSRLIFTTCIGAGLGLLRSQSFEVVVIDEASQQTEPASLVPLTKGCRRAILVGDHVQLRPTVQPHSMFQEFDVSLFERLYREKDQAPTVSTAEGFISRVMLDTQYRMHESICKFSSDEFYEGKLRTGITEEMRPIFPCQFPWPGSKDTSQAAGGGKSGIPFKHSACSSRMVFVECNTPEDLGQKSKSNKGQASLCTHICTLLSQDPESSPPTTTPPPGSSPPPAPRPRATIAVLTPYTRQADLLKASLSRFPQVEVCSIDGFQGREADVVVFVTVRCNAHHEIGFLKDMRRLNVALTRAKVGVVVVGSRATLTMGTADLESAGVWRRLLKGIEKVELEVKQGEVG